MSDASSDRERRLAEALRANLRRRKGLDSARTAEAAEPDAGRAKKRSGTQD